MSSLQALTSPTAGATPSKSTALPAGTTVDPLQRVRLHISPLTPELLKTYIPPSLQEQVSNISYHTVQTFPEKSFGFVELPTMEATKLKKKLNGSILKGSKVQIEEAKPEKRKKKREAGASEADGVDVEEQDRPKKKSKKHKEQQGVLDGIELPDERKVRRGWTEPAKPTRERKKKASKDKKESKSNKEKKLQEKSQFTKEPEMLFRTKLPLNAGPVSEKAAKKKSKKDQHKSSSDRDVVVHEFERTKKHATFLRDSGLRTNAKPASEFVEGKGWVDVDGNVVEDGRKNRKHERERVDDMMIVTTGSNLQDRHKPSINKKSTATNGDETREATEPWKKPESAPQSSPDPTESEDSDSSVVSSSSSAVSSADSVASTPSSPISTPRPSSILTSAPEIITTDPTPPTTATTSSSVHPLEALFKRPKSPTQGKQQKQLAPIKTSFTFFGGSGGADDEDSSAEMDDDADADDHLSNNPPHTPFTRQDLEWRGLRSAAPTPDTAAIGKKLRAPWRDASAEEDELSPSARDSAAIDEADEEDEDGVEHTPTGKKSKKDESEFARKFWENRAQTNKAWKDRRREAKKEKRRREDRKIGRR
ncbi:hypothetical protein EJ05DRAFT_473626 [Pseudovirgaria hyperparasitica]|uniref:Uncharacterized protein n=1 Tax=Pseudovirgaria hyperparasitica TaxID=470096 RepID=A0A6A6WEV1_9PEZI|nr:uncharacterized protein EJ05DRAFT_473626 [Pseudovirgaria hyperparasitica]KAF2761065.1 hypothetical protein EJ05DRAFT_473626 [Pseudovirgaria hyperparasitica]